MNRFKAILSAAVAAVSIQTAAYAADLSDWAVNEYIESNSTGLLSYNIVSGDLKSNITREEFCELAMNLYVKLTNEEMRTPAKSPFVDCSSPAVSAAYYNGIVKGVSEDEFEPQRPVTRQEMAVMLVNTLNAGEVNVDFNTGDSERAIRKFADHENVSDWAKPSLTTMINHSLLSGNDDNEIMPLANTTREQAITCVNRCYKNFTEAGQERYMLPLIQSPKNATVYGDVIVSWAEVESAEAYIVIIKDQEGNLVYNSEVKAGSFNEIIEYEELKKGKFSVTVGSKMPSGDTVFSLPVDFELEHADKAPIVTDKDKEKEEPEKVEIILGENEVMSDKAREIIAEAEKYIGIKYVYGGTTPDGFDCSGYVKYVFDKFGIKLKRVSRDQYAFNGTTVERKDLQPGDLVFFGTGGYVGHVGIYTGGGQMIHSPSTGKSICYTSINTDYYLTHYMGAKRVLQN